MAASTLKPDHGRNVFLFGPQSLSFTIDTLNQLRSQCLEFPYLHEWVLRTFGELPRNWATIATEFPHLKVLPAEEQLEDIIEFFRTGKTPKTAFPLPDLLLVPLVIVVQLTQYFRYRELVRSPQDSTWLSDTNAECVGFCAGVMSSLAVSCSTTREQLEQHGAIAVRLAMLIGAIGDVETNPRYVSISASWQTEDSKDTLDRILKSHSEAYISVAYDKNRATITTIESDCQPLIQELQDAGISAQQIGLRGRYHHPARSSEFPSLIKFCNLHQEFTLGKSSHLVLPARFREAGYVADGSLTDIILQAILVDQCEWHKTFTSVQAHHTDGDGSFISFGLENCIPPSYRRAVGHRVITMADVDSGKARLPMTNQVDNRIAVIGMSGRVPGASDLESFWKILCENKSQHVEVSDERFTFESAWRDVPQRKWFGNFVDDFNAFDNRFFNKSPREAAAMDPQQKMMLQVAYQAVQQSGYFQSPDIDKHIGCYIGVTNVDYQNNAACYPVSAFTATGALMSFISGKVSHYFGWTGPAMNLDTACSGSATAVHQACKAILNGECTTALAGGVNAITTSLWHQNLAGASFLSTTGQCKPFDAKGDGYCRAEAVGAVFLKRFSDAVADGDTIFGTIAATAVHQNRNHTAITVPNSPSLSHLFEDVTSRANINPIDVTVIEAHGTGTAVGDPAEYDGIRSTFGGPKRSNKLALGSVKGLVGHAECASGIVALLKTLLMVNESAIAPQASHDTINPALHASPSDNIEIPLQVKPWNAKFKAALINNYGASGNNASMVVTESPSHRNAASITLTDSSRNLQQPFWFSGADDEGLGAYVSRFLSFLRLKTVSAKHATLPNLSFNLGRQSNRSLDRGLILAADSIESLERELESYRRGEIAAIDVTKSTRPVILCFGGQTSTFVGLDQEVYERTTLLKKYLDQCDVVCKSMGLRGIYPDIFQRTPIDDIVQFQTAFFALQYSCAKSWIDCGVKVSAMVGHSFGEIVAQTVAGALSLTDGLKVIARRAALIRDSWGSDRGLMMAVEADPEIVEQLVARANTDSPSDCPAAIACFNGPRSFTLAGSTRSMQSVERILAKKEAPFTSVRGKMLSTSHAFHSTLVESLIPELKKITEDITFSEPGIRVERAIMTASAVPLTSTYIADHLRNPVCFNHAVQRLVEEFDNAVWLEAGSQSTVTRMASKALGKPTSSCFQEANLTSDSSWQRLSETTMALWKQGLKVTFWPHHYSQANHYAPLILPPYQFKKNNHYLDLKPPPMFAAPTEAAADAQPRGLWTFIAYEDSTKQSARFRVETANKTFQELMAGHAVARSQPLCPSTLQLDIATEAIRSLCPEFPISDFQTDLRRLENQAPLCRDPSRAVWLDVTALDQSRSSWTWKMTSTPTKTTGAVTTHASGKVIFRSRDDDEYVDEFRRFERLTTHKRCREILDGGDSDDILQGSFIYKLFADVVDYSEIFRGVRKLVGRGTESAGRVVKKYSPETLLDTPLLDSFCQVAGAFVNCMTQRSETEAYISTGCERIVKSPFIRDYERTPEVFDVLCLHQHSEDRSHYASDVFIFDNSSHELLGVILSIHYNRISLPGMAKLLVHLTPGSKQPQVATITSNNAKPASLPVSAEQVSVQGDAPKTVAQSSGSKVADKATAVLSEMIGIEPEKITNDTSLPDLGVDSLMGMEVARELEIAFECTLDMSSMMSLSTFGELVKFIRSALGENGEDEATQAHGESGSDPNKLPHSSASSSPSSVVDGYVTPATSSGSIPSGTVSPKLQSDVSARQTSIDFFVSKYAKGFSFSSTFDKVSKSPASSGNCVLITGATGSLGSQLVGYLASLPSVTRVVCFNRPSRSDATTRQRAALEEKGIFLDPTAMSKLHVVASDTSKAFLGLDETAYTDLASKVTHIIHNAWPMSVTRSINDFENQFASMRNLIDLSRDASAKLTPGSKVSFQFVSSIATVGLYPVITGQNTVPEEPTNAQYALPSGYSDSKLVCEQLLAQTLNQYPDRVNAMAVRVGQISGSKTTGYWNTAEHLSLIVKSAHTLNALPDLSGQLSWLPVEDVAAVLAELVLSPSSLSIYHVENPARQPWSDVISVVSAELNIMSSNIVPYGEWLERVRSFPRERDVDNPARKVMQFLEEDFLRMACGGLVLSTDNSVKISDTLARARPVEAALVKKYVRGWKESGFLDGRK